MERIKVGIIGSGFSAAAHCEALNRIPNVEVVAVASSSLLKSSEFAAKMNIPKWYESAEALIEDPHVHAVHNCTPNYLHYEINKKVLLAGKHLLSEKPLAINSEQSRELVELANRANVVSGVCFNYRHYPMVCHAKEMLASGEAGKPNLVYGGYMQDWLSLDTDYSWRLDENKNGPSRAIADIGSHWCDTVQYILNKKIVEVFADLKTVYPIRRKPATSLPSFQSSTAVAERENINIRTEDYGSVLVHFEDGITGVFTVSQVSAGRKNRLHLEISAERATMAWDQEKPNHLWIGRRNNPNEVVMKDPELLSPKAAAIAHYPGGHQEGWHDGMKNLFFNYYSKIKDRAADSCFASLADGHHNMKIIEAVLRSDREKSWIKID